MLLCWPCYVERETQPNDDPTLQPIDLMEARFVIDGVSVCAMHAHRKLPKPRRSHPRRQPDPVFEALASLHGGMEHLAPPMAKSVAVALAAIRTATPNVTPDEIERRAAAFRRLSWNRTGIGPTAWGLAKWWGDCAAVSQPDDRYRGSRTIDMMSDDEIKGATDG